MKILVSGSTGLVGSALVRALSASGGDVVRLVRSHDGLGPGPKDIHWNPSESLIELEPDSSFDAVVHLAGENIAARRWDEQQKGRIRQSRVAGTRLLAEALAGLGKPPRTLVCASAIGYYGDRGDEWLTEQSESGDTGFLPEVCRQWEAAAQPARRAGVRVVHLRLGVVLSAGGGALAKMLTPFRWGAGGRIGDGRQYMSWIALDDAVGAIRHCLTTDGLEGPANGVAPNPVTNLEFTKTLGRVLRKPTFFPMPAFAARMAFGEMADELLLASTRVRPQRLTGSGYRFQYPDLESALRHLLKR